MRPPSLDVYIREYCDLCTTMLAELKSEQARYGFELTVIDIDDDDDLEARYASLIPVVEHQGRVLFYYHIDHRALDAAFKAIG